MATEKKAAEKPAAPASEPRKTTARKQAPAKKTAAPSEVPQAEKVPEVEAKESAPKQEPEPTHRVLRPIVIEGEQRAVHDLVNLDGLNASELEGAGYVIRLQSV